MKKKKEKPLKVKRFEEIIEMNPTDILDYIKNNLEAMKEIFSNGELNAIYSRAYDSLYTDDKPPKTEKDFTNKQQIWLVNHAFIMHAIHSVIKENGRFPSVTEISEKVKLSRVTITKHLKHFEKEEFLNFHRQKWKLATENLMKQLYNTAFFNYETPARLKAAALFLKYADKILYQGSNKEEQPTKNFIQINNIYITQETIRALPKDKRQTIETLILEANEQKLIDG